MSAQASFLGDGSLRAGLARGVHVRVFEGETILLDSEGGDYFALNDVGGLLVQSLVAGASLEECARSVHETFQVEWETVCADLEQLYSELVERGLIVPEPLARRTEEA